MVWGLPWCVWARESTAPVRLHHPWDFPGKNTGAGCHFLLQCMKVKSESEVAQSCLTLSYPMDCSLPGSSTHGIFPGKSTGVGCHCLLQCMKVKSESEVAQSCPTLSDPMDCRLPGSSVHGIFQARVLEWGAIAFSVPGDLLSGKESAQTHVHRVSDAIQPSHPLSSPSPPAPNPSQHQSLFQ